MKRLFAFLFAALLLLNACDMFIQTPVDEKIDSDEKLQKDLLKGWNTWNNSNLLQQILMPEGLSLKISFRSTEHSDDYSYFPNQNLILSSPGNSQGKITPSYHSNDGSYTDLKLSWQGLTARVQTATQKGEIFILYTPEILPENPPIMLLETSILWNKPGNVEKIGGAFQAEFGPITYNIEVTEPDSLIPLPLAGEYLSSRSNGIVAIYSGKKRSMNYIQQLISDREELIATKLEIWDENIETYTALENLLGWNLIYDAFNDRALTTVSRMRNEKWGGYFLSGWDAYFTAAMYALNNKNLAYANVIAATSEITEEGFIPGYSGALSNGKSMDHSIPPIGSLITKLVYDKYPEQWFLEEVYDNLLSWNRWWPAARENKGFLSWGSNPSENPESNSKKAAISESGMDNSLFFDNVVFNTETHKLELASVDLLSLYITDCKKLAEIAMVLGKEKDSDELLARVKQYSTKLNELWDEKTGIYRDLNLNTNTFSKQLSATNFYSLLSGVPTKEKVARMIDEHFMNSGTREEQLMNFGTVKSSINMNNSFDMGEICAPMNFLVYLGMQNYDMYKAMDVLAENSHEALKKGWMKTENADAEDMDNSYFKGGILALIKLMHEGYWE